MSRAYRIAISETLRRHVKVDDGVQTSVELLPILPADRMCDLLAAELEELGFERDGQCGPDGAGGGSNKTARRLEEDGTEVTVDLEEGTVTVRLQAEAELELSRKGSGSVYDQRQAKAAQQKLRERLQGELERQADARTEELRQEVTDRLERKLKDLQQEIDGAVNRASAGALKEKAASLGEIEEISEDSETGSLTIRVRV